MTSDAVPAADAHRLLADVRGLAHRVRVAQRVTWLPLLAAALVTFGAIPVYLLSRPVLSDCLPAQGGQVCRTFYEMPSIYWWTGLTLAYIATAAGHLRVARDRGLGSRIRPYVYTGVALVALSAVVTELLGVLEPLPYPADPSATAQFLLRLVDPVGVIGLALLVLAGLERRPALLVFALAYLAVALTPINFGWGEGWGGDLGFAPQLTINGGVLLLGSAGFFVEHRWRHRG
ncbi:hypothetical protein [Dactylosporangium sp. NPDC051541]|uniref:hypothetical protein n=1 Tax=Dactylosporangium sp. NPDC051541 TaxID=3363977 RepID=UPI0037A78875